MGSGRSAIARLLFGIDPKLSGEILIGNEAVEIGSPMDAIDHGIALIPEDRLRQGVVLEHSVAANICLSIFDRLASGGWVSGRKSQELVDETISALKIKTASASASVRTLSGGNQQKVVLGKWLATHPRIVVLDEPTSGIDIGSKSEIIMLVRELARQGRAVIIISSELTELLAACDRILVMSDGALMRDMAREDFNHPAADGGHDLQFAERQLQKMLQEVRTNG